MILVGDILVARALGELLFRAGALALNKGLLEPAAAWAWNHGYIRLDQMTGGRLPDPPWMKELERQEAAGDQDSGAVRS